jgi:hypothetical protein
MDIQETLKTNVSAIIRSTSERTEELCRYSILQNGIPGENIDIIKNISPFSAALRKGYELAIAKNKKFTFFIDADMVVLPNALYTMIASAELLPDNTFFFNPLCFDYLSKTIYPNGPHLYRTQHIEKAFKYLSPDQSSIRPETLATVAMDKDGYSSVYLDIPAALHEFEQYYRDIFRRALTKYYKSKAKRREIKHLIKKEVDSNPDFQVASLAFEYAKKEKPKVALDYTQFEQAFATQQIEEKNDITNLEQAYSSLLEIIERTKNNYPYRGYTKHYLELKAANNRNKKSILTNKIKKMLFK